MGDEVAGRVEEGLSRDACGEEGVSYPLVIKNNDEINISLHNLPVCEERIVIVNIIMTNM